MFDHLPDIALSVRQPWAWAILNGKDIENRNWRRAYRGPIALHAAAGMTLTEYREAMAFIRLVAPDLDLPGLDMLDRGGIIGVVEITDCVTSCRSAWFVGRYGLVLRNARAAPFIPLKDRLGFFKWKGLVQ